MLSYPDNWASHPEDLPELHGPYELLELRVLQQMTLLITGGQLGRGQIVPRGSGQPKTVPMLRLFLEQGSKATIPPFWDCTAKHLIAALLPYLASDPTKYQYIISKQGTGPAARPTLDVRPR